MKFKDLIDLLGLTVYDEEIKNYIKNAMSTIEAKLHAHSNKTVLDNTTASFTEALLSKLNGIEAGANKIIVDSALSASSENPVQNKVVKSALDTKVPTSRKINGKALTADITLTASDVSAIPASEKGAAGGVAELDANGKILTSMLPGSVDEYIEGWLSSGSFYKEEAHTTALTPKTDAIYLDLHTMKTYRWSGSAYGVISETLAIGTTSSTAGRGDWTKTAYDHSLTAHAPSNAERNIIIGIQKNGTDLAVNSSTRKVNITVPTKLSELTNDKNFVDNTHTHTKANITDFNKQLTSEDLDDIKSVGFYYAGGGNTTINKPTDVDAYGMIVTHAASGYRKQILYSSKNRTYERLYNSSTWSSWRDITVETPVPTNAKFTDTNTKVTNTLATTTKAYITGTTSTTTNTGTQVFDTGVYLDTVAGQLVATTFKGNLVGNVTGSVTGNISGYSKSLYNYFSGRQSSLNFDLTNYNDKVFYTLATSSATEGKPPVDSSVLTMAWDNSGWGAQIALGINKVAHMYIRGASSVTTDGVTSSDWASSWFTVLDSNNYNSYALPLTGGTLTTSAYYGLIIKRSDTNGSAIQYSNSNGALGGAGFLSGGSFQISSGTKTSGDIFLANTTSATFPGTVTATKFIGALQGVADSALKADKLTTGRTVQTNLGSTSAATFDGTANITPGVTGTLPIKNGGTGATTAAGILTNIGITATAAEINKLDGLTATTTELNYIDGVTSAIQGQLDSKQAVITGGATTILTSNLTKNRALVSDSDGKVAVSAITSTELGYLDGVTSNIQTQINGKISNNVFTGDGTSGTSGYVAFAQLVITSNYTNRPIEFELICRGKSTPCYVSIMFSNADSKDPSIQTLRYWGTDYGVFAIKTTTSTWLLYYTKSERYDSVTVARVQAASQGITITYPGTFITEKPTENVVSAVLGGTVLSASTATTAATATKVKNNLVIKLNSGSTEDTNLFTFNGSAAKTINITPSSIGAVNKSGDTMTGDLKFSSTQSIWWANGAYQQKIAITDDSTADTAVFGFQQSSDSGNTFTTLMTIKDNGKVVANTFVGSLSGTASNASKVANSLIIKLNGGATEGTNLFTFNGSAAKTVNITPSSIGASSTNHTHGLLHSSFAKLIDNTTTDSGWSMLNSTYNGYLLLSLRTQKDAPVWTIGDYSAGIAFGGADTKGVITVSYSKPIIKFAGGNGTTPVWNLAVTGTTGTSYNLDNLTKVKQSATTTSNYRPLVMGAANSTDTSTLANTVTDVVCTATTIYAQPSTGTIFATKFKGAFEGNVTGNVSGTATKLAVKATVSTYDFTPSTYISDGQIAGIYNNNGSIDSNGFAAGNTSAGILFGRTNGAVMMAAQAGQTNPAIWVKEYYSAWGAWAKLIHSLNYTDYTVTKTGSGASGTWGISISGSAPKLTTARKISLGTSVTGSASFDGSSDITINVSAPTTVGGTIPYAGSDVTNVTVLTDFSKYRSYLGSTTIDGTWYNLISVRHRNGAGDGTSYGFYLQSKLTSTGNLIWNKQYGASSWQGERTILDSSNYTSYTVKKDGTGASGTWGISITGNASTATSATKATQDGNGSTITSTYLKLSGGTMSGNLTFASVTSTTYPALSNKIVWSGSTDGADIYYRVDANDAGRLVFNLRDDANTLICFAKNGTDFATINTSGVFSGYAALLANVGANCSTGKSTWNAGIEGKIVWGQKWNSTDFTYTNSEGTATTITDSGDVSFYLTGSSTVNGLYLNMAIDGSIYAEQGFSGNLSGTATKATQDSAGQQINTTYIKALSVSGQTITYTKGSGTTGTITTQDKNVYQSASTTSNFRPLLMGHANTTSASSLGTAVTNQAYVNTAIYAQPSTGTIYATKFSGALVGNSDTTTKWKTARTITINGDFTGSVSLDGSANVSFNLWNYYGKVSVGNTNNYPYHRIAKLDTITSSYQDRASTLYISQDYNGAGFGIIRICLRTNNTGSASSVEAYWLVRKGLAEDCVKIGIYNVFGQTYADVFFKTNAIHASTVIRDLASGARGAVNRTWTLINSGESNGTTTTDKLTSSECWIDIETAATELHSQAYSTIVTSSDAGDVYRSERAYNDESGNNIKTSYAASLSVSGTTVTLKSKSGATLSTITTQDTNTKNTAGSTDSSSKLFLIGATSQAANPQTYSHDTAYVGTDGCLYSNSKQVVNLSDTQALTNKTYNGYTLGAACAKAVTNNTSVGSLGWSSSIGTTNIPTMNTIAYWNGAYSGTSSNLAYCTKGAFGSIVTKNTGDYLSSSGGTLTGPLTISHQASATMSSDTNNPRIVFSENGEQPVILAYTDYDSYRSPAGLKVLGGSSASPAWFEVEGNLYASTVTASTFIGSLTGTASFTNNTWNSMGDDAFIGDCNQAGCIGIKGKNGATGIYFSPYSGSTAQKISINGSGTMTITGTVTSTGGVVSTTANGFRITQGNYGFFIRNDGGATYFLLTNSGDPYGSWNNLRPITINNSTGKVTINGNPMPSFSLSGNTLNITV